MSMKRAREVRRTRDNDTDDDGSLTKKPPEKTWDWEKEIAPLPDDTFVAYSPKSTFAKANFVVHTKFGKGVVLGVEPGKVEILFQEGSKKLAHGLP
jgi:hypothetical protein